MSNLFASISPTGRGYPVTAALLLSTLVACINPAGPQSDSLTEPPIDPGLDVVGVEVFPAQSLLLPGDTLQFRAEFRMANGEGVSTDSVEWTSDDGLIDDRGRFVAPNTKGKYRVVGHGKNKKSGESMADTADVTVSDAADGADLEPAAVEVSPSSAQIEPGGTRQFSAELRNADGVTVAGEVDWTAGGGVIDGSGRFTAGTTPGTYTLTAESANGMTGTADAEVLAPPASDPAPPANENPTAAFTFSCTNLACSFNGSGSSDPDGSVVSHQWTFGDGATGSGASVSHTFGAAGSYSVKLVVRDDDDATGTRTNTVAVTAGSGGGGGGDIPPGATRIAPGQNIQALVNASAPGTVFVLNAGVHVGQVVTPKDDQEFHGESGAIMDGNGGDFAFGGYGGVGARVLVKGIEIRNYAPAELYQGAIQGDNTADWVVEGNSIHGTQGIGVRLGPRMHVRGNHVYGNSNVGIGGFRSDGALVEDNEIDGNGFAGRSGEHSGLKILNVSDLVVRGNHVHDNVGRGIWLDTDIFDAIVENNHVHDNTTEGIWLEVVCGVVVRNNLSERNGLTGSLSGGWPDKAGIQVVNGTDVEIHGNTVRGNLNGISVLAALGYPTHSCAPDVRNVYVHHNQIEMTNGLTGMAAEDGSSAMFTSKNNRFESNNYVLGSNADYFLWQGSRMNEAEWKGAGQDVNGSFAR
ncbi:MAG: right-handed parallel beta-helix repeat-containing protein [Gemmatimonadota bacterium]